MKDAVDILKQRIAELESRVEILSTPYTNSFFLNRIAELKQDNERLAKCCTQRGSRMQIMREFLGTPNAFEGPNEWWYLLDVHPEAADWFDADGVPIDEGES